MSGASEIRLTVTWIAAAMQGEILVGARDREVAGVSIDTRTLSPGELYVGIRGDRLDGADFARAAVTAGAAGVVVPRGRGPTFGGHEEAVVIEVEDTTRALQALAQAIRVASGTKVVAITGSAGKTTTKEVTAEFLGSRYRVIRNRGNLNNHIGLPLSLVELRHRPDIAVVELGMNHAGEISTLVGIADPEVRVWTNVGDAHLGFFSSVDAIADAKAEICDRASGDTLLVANADDDRIMARVRRFSGRIVTFGIDRAADVQAVEVEDLGVAGTRARVATRRGSIDLETPLVGRANLANVLAAAVVALECGVDGEVIAERTRRLKPAEHRGEVIRLAGGVTIVDDSYNANPTAIRRALDVFSTEPGAVRRVAILGEMLELGDQAVALHRQVGRAAAARVDLLLTVGAEAAAALAAAAVEAGMPPGRVRHLETSEEAAEAAVHLVRSGDLVLVKGSRRVGTDRVVARLRAEWA